MQEVDQVEIEVPNPQLLPIRSSPPASILPSPTPPSAAQTSDPELNRTSSPPSSQPSTPRPSNQTTPLPRLTPPHSQPSTPDPQAIDNTPYATSSPLSQETPKSTMASKKRKKQSERWYYALVSAETEINEVPEKRPRKSKPIYDA